MGAVSDWISMGDLSRMRMWLLAIAVAILGTSALALSGLVDVSKSIYPTPNFTWLSYLVGGFLFGVGMTLGSGCGSKTLIRVGAGNVEDRHLGIASAAGVIAGSAAIVAGSTAAMKLRYWRIERQG